MMYTSPPAIVSEAVYTYTCVYVYQGTEYTTTIKASNVSGVFSYLETTYKGCSIVSVKKV